MNWQFRNDIPIYTQLIHKIKVAIVTKQFSPGDRLPSVRDLATEAGVNPNTMQRAMMELEREGLVYSLRTSGRLVTEDETVIAHAKQELAQKHLQSFLAAMKALGFSSDEIVSLLQQEGEEEQVL